MWREESGDVCYPDLKEKGRERGEGGTERRREGGRERGERERKRGRERERERERGRLRGIYLLAYRAPWVCAPVRAGRARLSIALLAVRGLVKNLTAQIVKAFTVGPLTRHQPRLDPSATRLSALQTEGEGRVHTV